MITPIFRQVIYFPNFLKYAQIVSTQYNVYSRNTIIYRRMLSFSQKKKKLILTKGRNSITLTLNCILRWPQIEALNID